MDFNTILEESPIIEGHAETNVQGQYVSIDFLNTHFGQYSTAQEMIDATESEGLKLYFKWLRDEGLLN